MHVLPGVYREQVVPPRGGTPDQPIRFLAEGPGAILDGADLIIQAGVPWTDDGNNLYWTSFNGESIYVAVDDQRVYDYQTLADLRAENGNIGIPGALPGGFFVDEAAGRLYLITPGHTDPAGHTIHVAVLGSAFYLNTITDVIIEGFEMRYYGRDDSYGGVGVDVRDSARCWVRSNTIHHVNSGVRARRSLASENVIEGNRVRDTNVYEWPWDSIKNHTPEATAISVTHGYGNVVRWNTLEGTFNGIYTGEWGIPDEEIARDTEMATQMAASRQIQDLLNDYEDTVPISPVEAPLPGLSDAFREYKDEPFMPDFSM